MVKKSKILCDSVRKKRDWVFPFHWPLHFSKKKNKTCFTIYHFQPIFINWIFHMPLYWGCLLKVTYNCKLTNPNVFQNSPSLLLQQMSVLLIPLKNVSIYSSCLVSLPELFHSSFKEASHVHYQPISIILSSKL